MTLITLGSERVKPAGCQHIDTFSSVVNQCSVEMFTLRARTFVPRRCFESILLVECSGGKQFEPQSTCCDILLLRRLSPGSRGSAAVGPRSRRAVTANPHMMTRPLAGNPRGAMSVRDGALNGRAMSTNYVDG